MRASTQPGFGEVSSTDARRELQAVALALMFGAGATLALLALAVPHGDVDTVPWAVNASIGLPVAIGVYLGRRWAPSWLFHVLLAVGGAMVAIGMTFGRGGTVSVAAAFFYVWVALYAFRFFSWRAATAHVIGTGVLLAIALASQSTPGGAAVWVLVMGTCGIVGLVTGLTQRELTRLATIDHLTGLPNRYVLDDVLAREIARAKPCSPSARSRPAASPSSASGRRAACPARPG